MFTIIYTPGIMSIFEHFRAPLFIMTAVPYQKKSVNNVAFFCITNEFIMTAFITTTSFQLPRQRNDHFSSFQGFCRKGKAYRYEKTFDLKPQI